MSACCPNASCFLCAARLSPRHEHDHWPVAERHGGTDVMPVCLNCHDLKDRVPLNNWPAELWAEAFADSGPLGRLLIAKCSAIMADHHAEQVAA